MLAARLRPAPDPEPGAASPGQGLGAGDDVRAAATAVLRWRAWWMGHHLPRRLSDAARLLPVLLHASFPVRRLSGEAPGVPGMRFRRRWSALARAAGLPPPNRMQRNRPVVEALLAVAAPDGLDLLVLARADASAEERGALEERLDAARGVLAASGAPLRARTFQPARLAADLLAGQRALAFGGLLAGRLPAEDWRAIEEGSRPADARALVATLAASAPTPLSTLALTLRSLHPGPGPLPALLSLLLAGETARRLADPDHFAVRWAAQTPALRPLLEEVLRLAERGGDADLGALRQLLEVGAAAARQAAGAIRAAPGPIDRVTRRLWREALGPSMPRVLLPALGDRLRALEAAGGLRLDPVRAGRVYEIRLAGSIPVGRGRDPVQARIRALGLLAQARAAAREPGAPAEAPARLDPTWRTVAERLERHRDHPGLLLVVEAGDSSRPGPPFDVLNRGARRDMEFEGALAVRVGPGRRPAGRMLSPPEAVEAILRLAPGAVALEVLAARPECRPMATRLGQIAALLRERSGSEPLAVEAGGAVYLCARSGLRRHSLDRFAARPRRFQPDPESPDLAAGGGRAWRGPGMLQCRASLAAPSTAALLYADGAGGFLRELVPIEELEEHLRESRAIVRSTPTPAVLAVRFSEDVEPEVMRVGQVRLSAPVAVSGQVPHLEVDVGGERFGGRGALGWAAAAEALLAAMPPGGVVRIGVNSVAVTEGGRPAGALLALWAASVARRRLRRRLAQVLSAYREGGAGRKAW